MADTTSPKAAEPRTREANARVADALPFDDREDFEDAKRGFVATLPEGVIRAPGGTVVWNLKAYEFLSGDAPPTVNPSLWRIAQLNMNNGLFKVVDRIWQIRGLDLANMTIIEGESGLILIDPLTTAEVARTSSSLATPFTPP